MYKVELSKEEIQIAAGLIDSAVRANGVAVAKNAVNILEKLQQAMDDDQAIDEPKSDEVDND